MKRIPWWIDTDEFKDFALQLVFQEHRSVKDAEQRVGQQVGQ